MAEAAHHYDSDPQQYPRLSPDEQRIADAVVSALRSELNPIKETQEQHTKILEDIQLELRHVNKILADAELIPDNPDL